VARRQGDQRGVRLLTRTFPDQTSISFALIRVIRGHEIACQGIPGAPISWTANGAN